MTDPSLIERVQKLLAKTTEAGCTPAEAETAFAMAARLMAQHNIDMATVESHRGEQETYGDETVEERTARSYLSECALSVVRRFFFVDGYFATGYDARAMRSTTRYILFGTPPNVAAASHVFRQYIAATGHAWDDYKLTFRCEHGRMPARSAKKDFQAGFYSGVVRKLESERRDLLADAPATDGTTNGTALAVIEKRIEAAFMAAHPDCKSASSRSRGVQDGGAFGSGRAAGSAFNPARPIGGGRRAIGNG